MSGDWLAMSAVAALVLAVSVRERHGSPNQAVVRKVQSNLTADLLHPTKAGKGTGKNAGHCYVASQTLWHALGGKRSGYTPQVGPAPGGGSHWWLRHKKTGQILDPTADQFPSYDYSKGRGIGFLTKQPSKRAQTLLGRIGVKA